MQGTKLNHAYKTKHKTFYKNDKKCLTTYFFKYSNLRHRVEASMKKNIHECKPFSVNF